MAPAETQGSLDGLTIVDFSRVLAGPLATMVLGDLGAEIIKIERPDDGDDTRQWGPPYDDEGVATYFLAVNRNKESVALDLRSPDGLQAVHELIDQADVIVENFRPSVMRRLGLAYDQLCGRRPDLVYCSISAFGSGPGSELPGYDTLVQAVGGLMSVTGEPDRPPQKVGVALIDVVAGLYATVGILAALRHRDRTGKGQRVEVDLLSALLSGMVNQATAFTAGGVVAGRIGNMHPSVGASDLFETADSPIMVGAGNDRQFGDLCRVLGVEPLARDERFDTNDKRVRNRDLLLRLLRERCAERSAADLVAELTDAGVPAGPVNDIAQAFEFAESLELDPIVSIPRGSAAEAPVRLPRSPIRMSVTPPTYRLAPPSLGRGNPGRARAADPGRTEGEDLATRPLSRPEPRRDSGCQR